MYAYIYIHIPLDEGMTQTPTCTLSQVFSRALEMSKVSCRLHIKTMMKT